MSNQSTARVKDERIRSGRSGQTHVWKRSKSKISYEYNKYFDNPKVLVIFQYFMNFPILVCEYIEQIQTVALFVCSFTMRLIFIVPKALAI